MRRISIGLTLRIILLAELTEAVTLKDFLALCSLERSFPALINVTSQRMLVKFSFRINSQLLLPRLLASLGSLNMQVRSEQVVKATLVISMTQGSPLNKGTLALKDLLLLALHTPKRRDIISN